MPSPIDFVAGIIFSQAPPVRVEASSDVKKDAGFLDGKVADALGISNDPEVSDSVIEFDVTTTETYNFDNTISDYAIEGRDAIQDHIRNEPDIFAISGVVSDSPINIGLLGGIASTVKSFIDKVNSKEERSITAFKTIKYLRDTKQIIKLTTSLGIFDDLVITGAAIARTPGDDGSLPLSIRFKKMNFAITDVGVLPSDAKPDGTQGTKNDGNKPPTPKDDGAAGAGSGTGPEKSMLYMLYPGPIS